MNFIKKIFTWMIQEALDEFSKFLAKYFFTIESPLLGDSGKYYWTSFAAARWILGLSFIIAAAWWLLTTEASEVKTARSVIVRTVIGGLMLVLNAPFVTYLHGFFNTFSRFFVDPKIVSGDGLILKPGSFGSVDPAALGLVTLIIFVIYLVLMIVVFFAQKFLLFSLTAVFVLMPLGIALYPFEPLAKYTKTFYSTYVGLLSVLPIIALISGISMTKLMNAPLSMNSILDACVVLVFMAVALCGVAFAAIGSITKVYDAGK